MSLQLSEPLNPGQRLHLLCLLLDLLLLNGDGSRSSQLILSWDHSWLYSWLSGGHREHSLHLVHVHYALSIVLHHGLILSPNIAIHHVCLHYIIQVNVEVVWHLSSELLCWIHHLLGLHPSLNASCKVLLLLAVEHLEGLVWLQASLLG